MLVPSEVAAHDWYHAMALGEGIETPGRFPPGTPPNWTLFPVWQYLEHITLPGMACLDIGTTDGIVAFTLKEEGAAEVVASDRGSRETFRLVREHLGLPVQYLPTSTLDGGDLEQRLEANGLPRAYDLVVLAGVIYHAYDPLTVLMYARRLLKAGGLIVVESACHPGDEAALHFNAEAEHPVLEPNTYFLPTAPALEAMLRFAACNPIATTMNTGRVAVLAQACRPSDVRDRSDTLRLIIGEGAHYGALNFDALERPATFSSIGYTGPEGRGRLDRDSFTTRFRLQPESTRSD